MKIKEGQKYQILNFSLPVANDLILFWPLEKEYLRDK